MTTRLKASLGLIALLIGATLLPGKEQPWVAYGLLSFGLLNVVATAPGTVVVRGIAIALSLAGIVWQTGEIGAIAVAVGWVIWLPAFLATWAIENQRRRQVDAGIIKPEDEAGSVQARVGVVAIIGAVTVASVFYRVLHVGGLQQTAALFIGIPALISVLVVFGVRPRSATGMACKAVTVGLLVSLIALQEGFLCVAMAAPLFYTVALGIGAGMDHVRRKGHGPLARWTMRAVIVVSVPMSLEGVTPATTISRGESIAVTRVVHAPAAEVEQALFRTPRFERERPRYLRAGFPSIVGTRIETSGPDVRWVMQVRGGEMRVTGMEPRTGELTLSLAERRPGVLRWRAVSDTSHTTHFLRWRESMVEWTPIDQNTTKVTWTLRYDRGLDPAWYFGPMERYAVHLAAGYLIDAVATP